MTIDDEPKVYEVDAEDLLMPTRPIDDLPMLYRWLYSIRMRRLRDSTAGKKTRILATPSDNHKPDNTGQ